MTLATAWKEQAERIREQAAPLTERAAEIKFAMKRTSGYQHDELLDELRRINRRLEKVAKEAAHCDMMATRQFEALR